MTAKNKAAILAADSNNSSLRGHLRYRESACVTRFPPRAAPPVQGGLKIVLV
jgi:hypothetical protein